MWDGAGTAACQAPGLPSHMLTLAPHPPPPTAPPPHTHTRTRTRTRLPFLPCCVQQSMGVLLATAAVLAVAPVCDAYNNGMGEFPPMVGAQSACVTPRAVHRLPPSLRN